MKRALVVLTALVAVMGAASAQAALKAVGPIHPVNKYPMYYEDQSSLRLELCLDWLLVPASNPPANQFPCLLAQPNPNQPISYPTNPANPATGNWSVENFYYFEAPDFSVPAVAANGSGVTSCGTQAGQPATMVGKTKLVEMAVEATYATGAVDQGQEMVFTRYRVRLDALPSNQNYVIRTPHNPVTGTTFRSDALGEINQTFDIGVATPDFTGALKGEITPNFLTWPNYETLWPLYNPLTNTGLRPGYVGDPGVPHVVTGGVNGFNKVSVTGPGIGQVVGSGAFTNCVQSDLFMIQGKLARNMGVAVDEVSYSLKNGQGKLDVFAHTVPSPTQAVTETHSGFTVPLVAGAGANAGKHVGHTTFTGIPPATVTVTNASDVDAAILKVTKTVTDKVVITKAQYQPDPAGGGILTVTAWSSDRDNNPELKVYDEFGPTEQSGLPRAPLGMLVGATLSVTQDVPPNKVIVVSAKGGRAEEAVNFLDASFVPAAGRSTQVPNELFLLQ